MADKTIYGRVKNLVKSASAWTTSNPTLLQGEVGFESDTGKAKLGDGTSAWNSLGYIKVSTIDNLTSTSTTEPLSANQGKLLKGLIDDRTPIATSVTIATADWSNYSCTKTVTGMTSDKAVIVTPDPTSMDNYVNASIKCTAQGTNSLTFTCTTTPSSNITVNIMMMEATTPPPPKRVGGAIFYIDSTADGEYTFYNANGDQVSAPTVGTDCTGWTYEVTGATKDKYYVYNTNAMFKRDRTGTQADPYMAWTYLDTSNQSYIDGTNYTSGLPSGKQEYEYYGYNGRVYETLDGTITNTAIGTGKANTAAVLTLRNGVYNQSSQIKWKSLTQYSETIWYICDQFNKGTYSLNGSPVSNNTECSDWYIPSKDELELMKDAIEASTFAQMLFSGDSDNVYPWSSSADSGVDGAWTWNWSVDYDEGMNDSPRILGSAYFCLALSRSF